MDNRITGDETPHVRSQGQTLTREPVRVWGRDYRARVWHAVCNKNSSLSTQGGEILGVISRRRVERFLDAGTGGEISLDAGSRDFFLSTQGRKISQCRRKEETLMQLERISC